MPSGQGRGRKEEVGGPPRQRPRRQLGDTRTWRLCQWESGSPRRKWECLLIDEFLRE